MLEVQMCNHISQDIAKAIIHSTIGGERLDVERPHKITATSHTTNGGHMLHVCLVQVDVASCQ